MEQLLEKVSELYSIRVSSSEKVTKGFLSTNYILHLEDGSKLFLKRYRFDLSERISEIHSVKEYFAQNGIPVILPLKHKEGSTFFFFDDGFFALFPFVSDLQPVRGSFADTTTKSMGEVLAQIHLAGKDSKLAIVKNFNPWNKEAILAQIDMILPEILKKTERDSFDDLALECLTRRKELISKNTVKYEDLRLSSDHLIHGDYLDHNIFCSKNGDVSYVFDFEKTHYSPRMFELFRSLMYTFILKGTREEIRQAKLYLDSYLRLYPATREELEKGLLIFFLKSLHSVWIENEHYFKNNYRIDELLAGDFERIQFLSGNMNQFSDKLFSKHSH